MPNDGEGYFTRVAIGLQGALADAEPADTASLSSHSSVSGGLPISCSILWIKSANSEQCRSHALRSMIMSFIALILF